MRKIIFLLVVFVCSAAGLAAQNVTEGSLFASDRNGKELGACPLKTTAVKADISGFLARVNVRQEFENKFTAPIEAVYVFPLSQKGAVDQMTMTVGTRVVRGKIMRREEARQTYETAKTEGKTASLLDQERPNVFTQSVANIMPGESVIIEISYVETLKYDDGAYEFVFPMTVGPRYIPGSVIDAAKITPPIAQSRNGSDISIEVNVNAGVPVEEIRSSSHEIEQINRTASESKVTLRSGSTIPNKDFVLRYDVTGKRIEDAVLAHRDERGGFFTMILQPPDKVATEDRTPKEIVFVLDTSGSMGGFPIEKAKEAMRLSLEGLYPEDTFNLITFAGETSILFDGPVPATQANLEKAQEFLAGRSGGGGTEMMKAIKASLDPTDAQDHLRIVCFMTDGYVGNENEIIAEVKRHPNARVFSFGIGSSVNRFLLDKIAEEGKGEAEYVALEDDGSKAARKFYERVRTPLLTDLSVDWNGMPVADVYPGKLTDLFSAKPVILHGRYTGAANGTIKLRGKLAGQPYERTINVNLPSAEAANNVLATLWARTRIDEISSGRLAAKTPEAGVELDKQVTNLALEYGIMSNFTSFVAVEDRVVNANGQPTTVQVPVVLPEGVSPETTVGSKTEVGDLNAKARNVKPELKGAYKKWKDKDVAYIISNEERKSSGGGGGGGMGSGRGTGTVSGSGSGSGIGYGSGSGGSSGLATSNQSVAVTGATAAVDVTSSAVSPADSTESKVQTTVTTREVQNLPLNGRTFSSLLTMTPGTSSGYTIDGERAGATTFVVDGQEVTNFRTGTTNDSKSASAATRFEGQTLLVPRPDFPAAGSSVKSGRDVVVDIVVDVRGEVVSAKIASGNTVFSDAALAAARLTKFRPTVMDSMAVRLTGKIVYRFVSPSDVQTSIKGMKALPATEAEKRLLRLSEKLHAWLYAIVSRLGKPDAKPADNESMFVAGGKAAVQIELTSRPTSVLEKLRAAGFEIVTDKGKTTIVGRVALEKLAALAEVAEVKLILPKI